jgi:hypothetical protein
MMPPRRKLETHAAKAVFYRIQVARGDDYVVNAFDMFSHGSSLVLAYAPL